MQARTGRAVAVGSFDREWVLVSGRGGSAFCFGSHGASVVASLAGRRPRPSGPRGRVCEPARRFRARAPGGCASRPSSGSCRRARGPIWAGAAGGAGRLSPLDDLEGPRRHGCSQRRRAGRRQTRALRVVAAGGAVAHRHDAAAEVRPARALGDRRRARSSSALAAPARVYVVSVVDDHSRLAYSELHSAEDRWRTPPPLAPRRGLDGRARLRPRPGGHDRQRDGPPQPRTSAPRWPSSAPARSSSRPTRHAGTARSSASTAPSTTNGQHPRSGPPATTATAPWHRFLRYYNRRRPHTSLGDRPPISRVHQDRGQDS